MCNIELATVRHRTLLVSSSTGSHESANVDVHTWQVDSGRARSSLGARSAPARYRTCRLSRHFTCDNSMRLEARLYVMLGSHRPTARRPHDASSKGPGHSQQERDVDSTMHAACVLWKNVYVPLQFNFLSPDTFNRSTWKLLNDTAISYSQRTVHPSYLEI